MKTASLRLDNDIYVNITFEDDKISMYTIDKEKNKTEYEVTPKSKGKKNSKANTEDK